MNISQFSSICSNNNAYISASADGGSVTTRGPEGLSFILGSTSHGGPETYGVVYLNFGLVAESTTDTWKVMHRSPYVWNLHRWAKTTS